MNEVRSEVDARGQMDWVGGLPAPTGPRGVGGRQAPGPARLAGAGYLDECTIPDVWERAKIRELADMGLPRMWLRVAIALGYDQFIELWRLVDESADSMLDSSATLHPGGSMIEMRLRRFSSFRRFQRNRYVEALAAQGVPYDEIRDIVAADLGEKLSPRHIHRLAERRRVKP